MKTHKKRFILLILLIFIIFIFAVLFVSCSEDSHVYSVAVGRYEYNEDTKTVTAVLRVERDSINSIKTPFLIESYTLNDGSFYKIAHYTMSFDATYFYAHMDEVFTDNIKNHDSIIYDTLNYKFEYATIYKSILSEGDVSTSGKNYIHSFDVSNNFFAFNATRKYANSAVWYSVLISASLLGVAIFLFTLPQLVNKIREKR